MTIEPAREQPRRPATPSLEAQGLDVSVIVPVHDEAPTLVSLFDECRAALDGLGVSWEVVFVDDGSGDDSRAVLAELHARDGRARAVRLRTNLGKSAALAVGFRASRGRRLVTIDGDLQDDPREIPRLLAALDEGADLVSGWKTARQDSVGRVVASRMFNALSRAVSGVALHDVNCGLKAYRRAVADEVPLYGELHRFIPLLAVWRGFRVTEIAVSHRPRAFGRSRYGWSRALRGVMDLVTVMCLTRYRRRPAHFFSLPGVALLAAGGAVCSYIAYLRLVYGHIWDRHPLLMFGVLLVVVGVQLFTTGLIGEMLVDAGREIERDHGAAVEIE